MPTAISQQIQPIIKALRNAQARYSLSGASSGASRAYIATLLQQSLEKTLVVIAETNREAEKWQSDLNFFSEDSAVLIPSIDGDVYSGISPHAEVLEKRAIALWSLTRVQPKFVVIAARAAVAKTSSPKQIAALAVELVRDEDFAPDELLEKLVECGYRREDPIRSPGEFSMRGGIIDVWSPTAENPVRIEFFGDTVDSIRAFDADTQLSIGQLKDTSLAPMREFAASADDMRLWCDAATDKFTDEKFERALRDRFQFASEGETFPGWEFLIQLVNPRENSVFDFLQNAVILVDESSVIENVIANLYATTEIRFNETVNSGEIGLAPFDLLLNADEIRAHIDRSTVLELRNLGSAAAETDQDFSVTDVDTELQHHLAKTAPKLDPLYLFPSLGANAETELITRSTRKFHGSIPDFLRDAAKHAPENLKIIAGTHGMQERILEILRDYETKITAASVLVGTISGGFEIPATGEVFYTEEDIFGEIQQRDAPRAERKNKSKFGAFISDFRDLKAGDFVVHVDHGVSRFEGLQTIESQGASREFMLLIYADNARLFVPVERLDLVSRYSSGEAAAPGLDRLGGLGWQKTKAKAKRAMRDMADELLKLYAERKLVTGYAFSGDSPWQQEFEDSFPYTVTTDQAKAIEDIKKDMETPAPMDRLVIGDVGYGKTEVAMRAAFKAVMDGKQVAVLTPTTVLAYQHYESFKKRFAAFPAKVELLSRFRTAKDQKLVVDAAEKGAVDILIGTHRVLSKDVSLPKLGLVVVDEEQRFGVAHKERLKQLKKKVDVLTLSATPIPRTLNMSMMGMRDLSVIETPPRDRLAINTQVVQFSENTIRAAIELELSRGGQVFFVHNRVETIDAIAAHIQKIVPQARIITAHGQMNENLMENAVLDFVEHKYDILVATTIIENGIDIPRANTIIINRADTYGLSQLYQLRGRVGRSNRRAYAYLLIPGELQLTPIARRRLSAIREFSDLGAGFRIAALDLELRGAGNILGGQQSGHLDALGFDLYTKMLERTIAEIRGDEIEDETSVSINLGIDVAIPKDYVQDTSQRLRAYKRISSAADDAELNAIYEETRDRYGRIPRSVDNLFGYARLRQIAERMRIISVDKTPDGLAVKFDQNARVDPDKLMQLLETVPTTNFSRNGILRLKTSSDGLIETACEVLTALAA